MPSRSARSSKQRKEICIEIRCRRCGFPKHFSEFAKGSGPHGRQYWCRECCSDYNKGRYVIPKDDDDVRLIECRESKLLTETREIIDAIFRRREAELWLPDVPKKPRNRQPLRSSERMAERLELSFRELERRAAKQYVPFSPLQRCIKT